MRMRRRGWFPSWSKHFRHKGIERFFKKDDARGINAKHGPRIRRTLDLIEEATAVEQLDIPGMHLHPLKFDREVEWARLYRETGASCSALVARTRPTFALRTITDG